MPLEVSLCTPRVLLTQSLAAPCAPTPACVTVQCPAWSSATLTTLVF